MLPRWCCFHTLWCFYAASAQAASVTSADATTSSSSSESTIYTIPLRAASGDVYFNAYVSDVALRLDIVQPDVWIPDADDSPYCSELYEDSSSVNETEYSECVDYITSMYGALYSETTETYTVSGSKTTETVQVVSISSDEVDIPYPNGIIAKGNLASADLYVIDNNGNELALTDFTFVYANETNMMTGGLGVANNPRGSGLLNYLYDSGKIPSHGYSAFLSTSDTESVSYGELLLGAVDKNHFTGKLYSYPVLPYEGLGSYSTLPTQLLTDLLVVNTNTSQSVSLFEGLTVPVLLDTRISFNSLPLEVIVRLAVQTNAYYNQDNDMWIVRCSDVENTDAQLNYKFGPLTIKAPLSSFLYETSSSTDLKFVNGDKACLLNVSPASYIGYSSLGLPFLAYAYFAMDNDGGNIALANRNTDYSVGTKIYSTYSNSTKTTTKSSSSTGNSSASYIYSGYIPFATAVNSTYTDTLTFSSTNTSAAESILTRYSVASIVSGEVYVSGSGSTTKTTGSNITTSKTSSAAAGMPYIRKESSTPGNILLYATMLLLGVLGGCII